MAHAITDSLKIALGQLNPTVGDLAGNAEKLRAARARAAAMGADLVVLPELFITGYPPEDLVRKPAFAAAARETVEALAAETADEGPGVLVGAVSFYLRFLHPMFGFAPYIPPMGYRPLLYLVMLLETLGFLLVGFGLVSEQVAQVRDELEAIRNQRS